MTGHVTGVSMQSPDACHGAIDDASQFAAKLRRAALNQALLRFFGGKPGGISIRLLRRFQAKHLAKVSSDGKLWLLGSDGRSRRRGPLLAVCRRRVGFATEVTGEGSLFHPSVNASLLKSLEGSGLGTRKAGFHAAFGKNPTSAASLHQQEFDAASANAVANGGNQLATFW